MVIGAFNERYVLSFVAGVAIVLSFAICRFVQGDPFVGTILTVFFLGWFVFKTVPEIKKQMNANGGLRTPLGEGLRKTNWMHELERSDLPIAVTPATIYLQIQRYAPNAVKPRLFYLTDVQKARIYGDVPSSDINMILFSRLFPLQVMDYQKFLTQHAHFLVCLDQMPPNWLLPALAQGGPKYAYETAPNPTSFLK